MVYVPALWTAGDRRHCGYVPGRPSGPATGDNQRLESGRAGYLVALLRRACTGGDNKDQDDAQLVTIPMIARTTNAATRTTHVFLLTKSTTQAPPAIFTKR